MGLWKTCGWGDSNNDYILIFYRSLSSRRSYGFPDDRSHAPDTENLPLRYYETGVRDVGVIPLSLWLNNNPKSYWLWWALFGSDSALSWHLQKLKPMWVDTGKFALCCPGLISSLSRYVCRCWLASWLVGWCVDCLLLFVGWLIICLMVSWLVGSLVG